MQGATSGICDSALPGTCGAACEIPLCSLLILLPRHKTQQQQCKGGQEYLAHGFRSYQSTVTERHVTGLVSLSGTWASHTLVGRTKNVTGSMSHLG